MRAAWCPFAVRTEYPQWPTGALRDAVNRKAVWHTTEGGGTLEWYKTSGGIPHFTILKDGTIHQHYSCHNYSRALRNLRGGVETNTDGALQIEIQGFAGKEVTPAQRASITRLASWLTTEGHVDPVFPMGRLTKPYRVATFAEWDNGKGHFAHGQVPEQDHQDPDMTDLTWQALVLGVGGTNVGAVNVPRALRRGDQGNDVREWQDLLIALGHPLPKFGADSDFGEETETATKALEARMNLVQDGAVSGEQFRLARNLLAGSATLPEPPPLPPPVVEWVTVERSVLERLERQAAAVVALVREQLDP